MLRWGLELASSRISARARLLERALHDPGPWQIIAGLQRARLRREVLAAEGRVTFTAYLGEQVPAGGLAAVWCGDEMAAVLMLPAPGPCRVVMEVSIAELAAA